jgi:murein L,D-transpeptidase YcbB/YkuD
VPPGITRRETIPAVVKDPGYLAAHDMEVVDGWGADAAVLDPAAIDWQAATRGRFPYRFRQLPGPGNALGQVKFMFPNDHNVYIHDTPARELFERPVRAFSHGCIRVADPLALAAHLLARQDGWSRARIDRVIANGSETFVPLAEPVPVHVSYFTAWSDGGVVNFRSDVYDRDPRLDEALLAAPAKAPSA